MTHTKSVRRITSHSLTLVENGLIMSYVFVLLAFDHRLTESPNVRQKRKTKHQKTNALANCRQTHSIWYPCLQRRSLHRSSLQGRSRTASGGFVTSWRSEARCSRRILSLSAVIFNSMRQFFSATQSGPPQSETIPALLSLWCKID
jgi:hypothetical protein